MGQLFEELKRRSVFKVAAAYLVVGWVLVQVADTIAPMMSLPDTAPRYVLFLLIILFPIALFLAWAFDIRPTDGERAARDSAMKGFLPVAASVLVLGVFSFVLLRADADVAREPTEPVATEAITTDGMPAPASLAVLPFTDLSPEGDQEYFGDGIAEALLNVLASLDGLSVASRTSAFAFKGANRNVVEIANILNVAHVLEGSVRKAGDRVLITAQLIDAQADRHLLSATFEHELTTENLFAIQDSIANAIVVALRSELGLGLEGDIEIVPVTENLDAYDLYLQAQQLTAVGTTENVRREVELTGRAVELDPNFAEAWAHLAWSLSSLPTWDHSLDPTPYNRRAIAAADRSLALDPLNSTAFRALGEAYFGLHDWERADDVNRRAQSQIIGFDRNPMEPMGLGYLSRANDQARDLARRFPEQGFNNLLQGLYLEAVGENEAAIKQFELAIVKGYNGGAEWNMASAYWGVGQTSVWTAVWAREMLANDPELLPLLPHMRDLLLAGPAEKPRAALRFRTIARELGFEVEDLVRLGPRLGIRVPREVAVALGESEAVAEGFWSNYPKFWMWSQSLRDFRQSEAFRSRVRDSGMLAYWRSHGWPDLCRPVGAEDFECD